MSFEDGMTSLDCATLRENTKSSTRPSRLKEEMMDLRDMLGSLYLEGMLLVGIGIGILIWGENALPFYDIDGCLLIVGGIIAASIGWTQR